MIMHKINDNYGGRTCQLDWKYFIASNTSPKLEWQTHAVDSWQISEGN